MRVNASSAENGSSIKSASKWRHERPAIATRWNGRRISLPPLQPAVAGVVLTVTVVNTLNTNTNTNNSFLNTNTPNTNTNSSCGDLSGCAIYLWHCGPREGRYSMYSSGVTVARPASMLPGRPQHRPV
jgi:hypothetical protein